MLDAAGTALVLAAAAIVVLCVFVEGIIHRRRYSMFLDFETMGHVDGRNGFSKSWNTCSGVAS